MNTTLDLDWLKSQLAECELRLKKGPSFGTKQANRDETIAILSRAPALTRADKTRLDDLLNDRADDNIGLRNKYRWKLALEDFAQALRDRIRMIEGDA